MKTETASATNPSRKLIGADFGLDVLLPGSMPAEHTSHRGSSTDLELPYESTPAGG